MEPMTSEELKKLRAQAKVGLDALIDEATGYQAKRPKDDLRRRYEGYGGDADDYIAPDFPPEDEEG